MTAVVPHLDQTYRLLQAYLQAVTCLFKRLVMFMVLRSGSFLTRKETGGTPMST